MTENTTWSCIARSSGIKYGAKTFAYSSETPFAQAICALKPCKSGKERASMRPETKLSDSLINSARAMTPSSTLRLTC